MPLIYFPKVYILKELHFILFIFRDRLCTSCTGLTGICFAASSWIYSYGKQRQRPAHSHVYFSCLVCCPLYFVSYLSIIHSFSLIPHLAVLCMVWLPPIAPSADQRHSSALFFVLSWWWRRWDLWKPYLLICIRLTCKRHLAYTWLEHQQQHSIHW